MRLRFASLPVGLFILLALILGGCGSSPTSRSGNGVAAKTPAEILSTAKAAAAAAASVHVAGSIVSEGKPISLDMELVGRNEGKGSVTLEGLEIRLIDVDGAVFVKGSKAFYTRVAGAKAANLLQGKWIEGSATKGPLASFAALADLDKVIDSTLADHGTLSRAPLAEARGEQAVGVTDATRDGTLYVATTGVPYPLEIVKSSAATGARAGTVVFDRWNEPVSLAAPAHSISLARLSRTR
ncbi:MAG TPA: hypothetical protein VIH92_14605 [Solirubrobacteraceae bacterium]